MTVSEGLVKDLIALKQKMNDVIEAMGEAEDCLAGMEVKYQGNYASIMYVDGNTQKACLYVEDEDGDSWEVNLPLDELMRLVS